MNQKAANRITANQPVEALKDRLALALVIKLNGLMWLVEALKDRLALAQSKRALATMRPVEALKDRLAPAWADRRRACGDAERPSLRSGDANGNFLTKGTGGESKSG